MPHKVAIQQETRTLFKETRQPPDQTAFWLGMYTREKWQGVTVHNSIAVDPKQDGISARNPDGSARPNTYGMTVVIGKLYVHVMGSIFPEFARKQRLDKAGFPMSRLWPRGLKAFTWPSADLTDGQASGLATALIDYYRRNITDPRLL